MGSSDDDSWSGLFRQIRAGNNDKTTVAGKGILLAMCHLRTVLPTGFGIDHHSEIFFAFR